MPLAIMAIVFHCIATDVTHNIVSTTMSFAAPLQLFFLSDSSNRGVIMLEDLAVELQAGNVSEAHTDNVLERLQAVSGPPVSGRHAVQNSSGCPCMPGTLGCCRGDLPRV